VPGKDGLADVQLACSRDQLQAGFVYLCNDSVENLYYGNAVMMMMMTDLLGHVFKFILLQGKCVWL